MIFALVKINRGIIDGVQFYFNEKEAIKAIDEFTKNMNPEHEDAAVFGQEGMVTNAKDFLDDDDQYVDHVLESLLEQTEEKEPVFIIGNPSHYLGFMVASPDDPMGYRNSAEAVSVLGQMRMDHGNHLSLFQVIPVAGPIVRKVVVGKYNKENEVEDFDYSLIEKYTT